VAQEKRPQLQVGLEFELQAKSGISASCGNSLMELDSDDVKSVAVAKILAVKDLVRAIDYAESVAQDAKRTLVAARLTQVLLIQRDSTRNQTKHCERHNYRIPVCTSHGCFCAQMISTSQMPGRNQACAI
jgi:hypothetical protein